MEKWYVLQTKQLEEERAFFFLHRAGLEVYLPKMEICVIRRGRKKLIPKPLFPGYLFAHFDVDKKLHEVRWTKGINRVLPESISPIPIQDSIVVALKKMGDRDTIIRKRDLKANERIKIVQGPMKDLLGLFENWVSEQGRVRILLDLLNYQVRVELHNSMIEKVA